MKRNRLGFQAVLAFSTILLMSASHSFSRDLEISGEQAPALWANSWTGLDQETGDFDLRRLKGRVVYIFFYQSWCPGCHSHGFPSLKEVQNHFRDNERVFFLAVQTVFEGFSSNNHAAADKTIKELSLEIPHGHDSGPRDGGSVSMRRYRSGGTPWTVIVDTRGQVRFNGFQLSSKNAVTMINGLLGKKPGPGSS